MNNNINKDNEQLDLLDFLKYILGCTYMSDLKNEPYITKAKLILKFLNLKKYSIDQIRDTFEYLYGRNESK